MKRVAFVVRFEEIPTDAGALAELLFGEAPTLHETRVAQQVFCDLQETGEPDQDTLLSVFMEGTTLNFEPGAYTTEEGFDWGKYEKDRQTLAERRFSRFHETGGGHLRILTYPDIPGDPQSEILMYEGAFDNLHHERFLSRL